VPVRVARGETRTDYLRLWEEIGNRPDLPEVVVTYLSRPGTFLVLLHVEMDRSAADQLECLYAVPAIIHVELLKAESCEWNSFRVVARIGC
jgi:hypothetical protein